MNNYNKTNIGNFLIYNINRLKEKNIKLFINNGSLDSTWDEVPIKDDLVSVHTIIKRGTVLLDEIILITRDLSEIEEKIVNKIDNKSENINVNFKIIGSFYHTNDSVNICMKYDNEKDLLLIYKSKWVDGSMKPVKVLSIYNILDDIPVVVSEGYALNLFNLDNSYLTTPNSLLLNSSDTERKRLMINYPKSRV